MFGGTFSVFIYILKVYAIESNLTMKSWKSENAIKLMNDFHTSAQDKAELK